MEFPELTGAPIEVCFRPALRVCRGKLVSNHPRGAEVHAGSYIRERRIVIDASLRRDRREFERILLHEIFHFVWPRIGNRRRREFEALIAGELRGGVAGELGWSAEWRKNALRHTQTPRRGRHWREYLCESFCDTGAWRWSGGRHAEFTLSAAARRERRRWWDRSFGQQALPV
ncbi:MAG TPA: hypothetical protein DEQ47_00615 [Solibacterales bacterium]|nr:hypothetical protein [Bryobacterales bacterium]